MTSLRSSSTMLAVPQEHGAVGQPARLLREVGHQDDGHVPPQFLEHVLDAHRGHRVNGDGELVEAEDLGLVRKGAGDGQALLLAAGKLGAEAVEAVLHFVPQRRLAQALLDDRVQLAPARHAGAARGEGHVVVDAHGQTHGQRRDHADLAAEGEDVVRLPHVFAVHPDRPRNVRFRREVDGAVEAAEQRGLARLRGADNAEDLVAPDVEGDAVQHLLVPVGEAQVLTTI